MAAWLTYLKSRLLLPALASAKAGERPAEELAQDLALRLLKLDALRKAGEALQDRPRLGRDVFVRGDPEAVQITGSAVFEGDLYALVQAYVAQRMRTAARHYRPAPPRAYALEDASHRLRGKLPELRAWTALAAVAPFESAGEPDGPSRASYLASTLAAGLELVREGELEARQLEAVRRHLSARPPAPGGRRVSDLAETERRIEALLFAAAGPLSAADLARRLPEGADVGRRAGGAAGALRGAGRDPGLRRRPLALPDRGRPRLPDDRGAAGAAAPVARRRWRRWPSSPTTSPPRGPRSRRCAACRRAAARSTFCSSSAS